MKEESTLVNMDEFLTMDEEAEIRFLVTLMRRHFLREEREPVFKES